MSCFITLEGPEGGGKSTQAQMLVDYLSMLGHEVVLTREPGGTGVGEQIRRVLTSLENTSMHPRTEILLFSASRAQLVSEVIRPHLECGRMVVSDRFYDSTLAYQGYGRGLDLGALRTITAFATGGLVPDLTILLDLPVEVGLQRREQGGGWNRLDATDVEFHHRVRQGYLELAAIDPARWVVIDAQPPVGEVQETVRLFVTDWLAEFEAAARRE